MRGWSACRRRPGALRGLGPNLMAMPSEPEVPGSRSKMSRPLWVTVEGLACTVAPHSSISMRR